MDPAEGNLFDIPDYEHTQDEEFQALPPPASPGGEDEEETEEKKSSQNPTRKGVRRPMPKLDAQRLTSERGLPALRNMFDNVQFKRKGHEAADLKMLVTRMEHWAHRLFPKLQFEDFVERVECLGNKKEVQTCLKRIRLDLPILHEDFTGDDGGNSGPNTAAEELDVFSENRNAREENVSIQSASLTEEQQQRIERNKWMALERRQAKLQLNSQTQEENELPAAQPNEECENIPAQEQDDLTAVEAEDSPFVAAEDEMQSGPEEHDQ
ncbi:TIMELESS-interacting protein isoform X2 [Heteronotia binoei]|uniref:TIMELESS-interacting protein isoform X2 n=1 Tax=Heteronotia binoei TaxID=13085 RepID=UPI00292D475E|nr:TIMELESS-interacting protein isoform X2 [Heteronotia binoei]XP_060116076.1 TIMELESS-interacting protein isoform X2 [Heteronotia binoei]